ncbi:MAG: hypothetical protein ACYCW6_18470, partial [Candidatus Xenobia bacterium]
WASPRATRRRFTFRATFYLADAPGLIHSDAVRRDQRSWDQADAAELFVASGAEGQLLYQQVWIKGIDIPGDV